ncbi:hypothetical protein AZE42_03947 [Rhizopogon vesiculosus]|uniref:Uncharacterized protein n=1 Tax=Rhizopogon vesiculosus TaxID=180088 RepID=A0A1J8PR59_9AGAM|nr:hypothetical protein AZE42_03947 [Rhizopogon vesiculosus]
MTPVSIAPPVADSQLSAGLARGVEEAWEELGEQEWSGVDIRSWDELREQIKEDLAKGGKALPLSQVNQLSLIRNFATVTCTDEESHASLPEDALRAFDMNKSNGGKQRHRRDTVIPQSNPSVEHRGKIQKMTAALKACNKFSKNVDLTFTTYEPSAHQSALGRAPIAAWLVFSASRKTS